MVERLTLKTPKPRYGFINFKFLILEYSRTLKPIRLLGNQKPWLKDFRTYRLIKIVDIELSRIRENLLINEKNITAVIT